MAYLSAKYSGADAISPEIPGIGIVGSVDRPIAQLVNRVAPFTMIVTAFEGNFNFKLGITYSNILLS
ncbi:hypothetical protein L6164_008478 [Bauhinia variegata]|uniref:Uncharacterized protein n=1 Tax=Bauhinia variegata TaxID=167791 RepID=A0ACB9PME0_BAUVA|nr:hypothetical protein L6164_008478 [Bauhinia variegata]